MASATSTNGRLSEAFRTIHTEIDRIGAFLQANSNEVHIARQASTADREALLATVTRLRNDVAIELRSLKRDIERVAIDVLDSTTKDGTLERSMRARQHNRLVATVSPHRNLEPLTNVRTNIVITAFPLRAEEIERVPSERLIGVLSELGTMMNTRDFSREEIVAAFKIAIGMD